ncbi:MAG: hypothetical protein U5K38_18360 [Woeseiaceae bacterium]|nr:hypothetical protein [Woeseiaceae bacterium]
MRTGRRAWMKSTQSCSRPTTSSAYRSMNSGTRGPVSLSMPYSTAYPSRRRSRRSSAEAGVIFCSFCEAVQEHPELVRKYLGIRRAVHATTSSRRSTRAVFSDGSFVYMPKGVR